MFSCSIIGWLISPNDAQQWRQTESTFKGLNKVVCSSPTQQKGQNRKAITSLHVTGWAWIKMLIAFEKSSPNKPTQNGDALSLEEKDFTIQWPACASKERAFVLSCSGFMCVCKIATVLHGFVYSRFLACCPRPPTESKPSHSQHRLFSPLYLITAERGHTNATVQ